MSPIRTGLFRLFFSVTALTALAFFWLLMLRIVLPYTSGRTDIILCISGPASLVMAFYANGGPVTKMSFIVLSLAWWACTLTAYRAIRAGDIRTHAAWMIRGYALTLSAITLRLMQFALAQNSGISPEAAYGLIAWPSWLVNWFVAECFLVWPGWFRWVYSQTDQ